MNVEKVMQKAKSYCEQNKYRFTEPREKVLRTILEQNAPISAYDILDLLSISKNINPPTVYRAIDFWSKHSFIHRVESLNCYIACDINHNHKGVQILICDRCGLTKEAHLSDLDIAKHINIGENESFQVMGWNIEIHGLCLQCM